MVGPVSTSLLLGTDHWAFFPCEHTANHFHLGRRFITNNPIYVIPPPPLLLLFSCSVTPKKTNAMVFSHVVVLACVMPCYGVSSCYCVNPWWMGSPHWGCGSDSLSAKDKVIWTTDEEKKLRPAPQSMLCPLRRHFHNLSSLSGRLAKPF